MKSVAPKDVPSLPTGEGIGMQGRQAVERFNLDRLTRLEKLENAGHKKVRIGKRTLGINTAIHQTERRVGVMPLARWQKSQGELER